MKRSQINRAIYEMERLLCENHFQIPPFCKWTPEEWKLKNEEYDEICDNMMGWDVTDYGEGKFDALGFVLITIRNGDINHPKCSKPYAEKLLMLKEGQYSPMHFHYTKMEDIINRGGGNVLVRVYNSSEDEGYANTDVKISSDGREYYLPAGTQVKLCPGESITIYPYLYHDFEVQCGTGPVLLGEVSSCNDDVNDNRFYEKFERFPNVEEDEKPYRLLCTDYKKDLQIKVKP